MEYARRKVALKLEPVLVYKPDHINFDDDKCHCYDWFHVYIDVLVQEK